MTKKNTRGTRKKTQQIKYENGEIKQEESFVERDINWQKCFHCNLMEYYEHNSSVNDLVLHYIFEHKDKFNQIHMTMEKLEKITKVRKQHISKAFKEFYKYDIIRKIQNGQYMINPDIMYVGDDNKRLYALKAYGAIQKPKELIDNLKRKETIKKLKIDTEKMNKEDILSNISKDISEQDLKKLYIELQLKKIDVNSDNKGVE